MKQNNKITGNLGEDIATKHLIQSGYTIISRNFSTLFGEIDIIAKDNQTIVFVEVKTKIGSQFGTPEEMVNRGKIARIQRMANLYLTTNNLSNQLCRVDMIAIVLNPDHSPARLTHYPNVS